MSNVAIVIFVIGNSKPLLFLLALSHEPPELQDVLAQLRENSVNVLAPFGRRLEERTTDSEARSEPVALSPRHLPPLFAIGLVPNECEPVLSGP